MRFNMTALPALATIALFSLSPAMAQNTNTQGSTTSQTGSTQTGGTQTGSTQTGNGSATQNGSTQRGVTSGPASGRPATLGTGGVTTATPHQTAVTGNHAGTAVRAERRGQQGGTRSTVRPGESDAGAGAHNATNQQQRQ